MTWKPDTCLYHGNCDDGFGAAYAIWKKWPDIEFAPCFYDKPIPNELEGKNILFVDFSIKKDAINDLAAKAKSIVLIDHHKSAQAELSEFRLTYDKEFMHIKDVELAIDFTDTPVVAWFDMEQSGATMAWQFAHGEEPIPEFLKLIEDRDLWKFELSGTRAFSAKLRTLPYDFEDWDFFVNHWDVAKKEFMKYGKLILEAHETILGKILKETRIISMAGYNIPAVNAPYHYASDAASLLLERHKDAPFTASWFYKANGEVQFSLRSDDNRQDVSEIAIRYGGGGHRNSAGFSIKLFNINLE